MSIGRTIKHLLVEQVLVTSIEILTVKGRDIEGCMPITCIGMSDRAVKLFTAIMAVIFAILVVWGIGIWLGVLPSSF